MNIKRLVVIYGIVTSMIVLLLVFFEFSVKRSFPRSEFNIESNTLVSYEYGNTISNINNRGHAVGFGENIILATYDGLIEVDIYNRTKKKLTDEFCEFLNVIDSKVYFMNASNDILYYDSNIEEIVQIKKIPRYKRISAFGDILFGYSGVNYSKCDAYNLAENKAYYICDMYSKNYGNYYNDCIYYYVYEGGEYSFIKYSLLDKNGEILFDAGNFDFTWTIYNNKIIYSSNEYNDGMISNGIYEYDINEQNNNQLLIGKNSYRVQNVINNNLIYSDGSDSEITAWYMYNFDTHEVQVYECDGRCESIFVVNNIIIVKSIEDGVRKYKFFDEDGAYLDFELIY